VLANIDGLIGLSSLNGDLSILVRPNHYYRLCIKMRLTTDLLVMQNNAGLASVAGLGSLQYLTVGDLMIQVRSPVYFPTSLP
jgi:hypothetical protein